MSERVVGDLKAARALIGRGWTRGTYARDRAGRRVQYDSPRACRFCPLGAVVRVSFEASAANNAGPRQRAMFAALGRASGNQPFDIVRFNDWPRRKKSEVLALFSRAIATEEAAS